MSRGPYVRDFREVAGESTCQKRVTVCTLLEPLEHGWLLVACESNRCEPDGGTCHRLGTKDAQATYPADSQCNWTHAEIRAIAAIPPDTKPTRAVIFGHDFPCPSCEAALRAAGIERIEVDSWPEYADYVGLR